MKYLVCLLPHQAYRSEEHNIFVDLNSPWKGGLPDPYKNTENLDDHFGSTWICRNTKNWPQNKALQYMEDTGEWIWKPKNNHKIFFLYYANKADKKYLYRHWKAKKLTLDVERNCTWILEIEGAYRDHYMAEKKLKRNIHPRNILTSENLKKSWYKNQINMPYIFWHWNYALCPKAWMEYKDWVKTTNIHASSKTNEFEWFPVNHNFKRVQRSGLWTSFETKEKFDEFLNKNFKK